MDELRCHGGDEQTDNRAEHGGDSGPGDQPPKRGAGRDDAIT